MSTNVSALKPEYRQMVESEPNKYDPNSNGVIDENEIGTLLAGAKEINSSVTTLEDLLANENAKKTKSKKHNNMTAGKIVLGAIAALGIAIDVIMLVSQKSNGNSANTIKNLLSKLTFKH